jgi:hypothetical protein
MPTGSLRRPRTRDRSNACVCVETFFSTSADTSLRMVGSETPRGHLARGADHDLQHTWASLHMARGTPLKWIQEQGGCPTAKILLDTYGQFMPTESRGFANAIMAPDGPSDRSGKSRGCRHGEITRSINQFR